MTLPAPAQTFSNIKKPRLPLAQPITAPKRPARVRKHSLSASLRASYRPRYLGHVALLVIAGSLVMANSATHAHSLSVRLLTARGGAGSLDATTTATVAADVAKSSNLLIAPMATKVATQLSQQVALPTADTTALAKPQIVATAGNAAHAVSSYTVAGGDTLSSIASKFNITSNTIKWANGLSDDNSITPGQSLVILPVTGLQYTVAAGDTPDSLASSYSSNAAQIISYNNAEVKGIVPGQKIIIPDGVKPEPVAVAKTTLNVPATSSSSNGTAAPITHYSASAGNTYSYGYCTWYVASRRAVPSYWGDTRDWYYNAQASGFSVGAAPEAGAIAWTGAGYFGHVAYVESVSGNMVTISEMNATAGWGRVDTRTVPASNFRYIY